MTTTNPFPVDSFVVIGTAFEMAERAPFSGNGRQVSDKWTGAKMYVTGYTKEGSVILGMEKGDDDLVIHLRRLSLAK